MERNFKNYIVWEEPNDERLSLTPKKNLINTEEVQAIFDTEITDELVTGQTTLLENVPVEISCEAISSNRIKIFLDVFGSPPFKIRRNGKEIASQLFIEDFPYVDNRVEGTFLTPFQKSTSIKLFYEIESSRKNIDSCSPTIN